MNIYVNTSSGFGSTTLGAFDRALYEAGVGNFNVIRMSSILPPGSRLIRQRGFPQKGVNFGDRLYAVYCDARTSTPGEIAVAALGWYQFTDKSGLFVEYAKVLSDANVAMAHEGALKDLKLSMQDLLINREIEYEDKDFDSAIAVTSVESEPGCALAIAAFLTEPWRT